MAIHNGKFFDVEVTRAFFTDLADGYNEFNRNAKIHRGTLEDFVNTDAWQGKDAENAKKLMKANKITLLNEVLDLQAEATKLSEHILDKFRIEVDNAPDARIEYDTLWQINDDYKNLYFDYMDIHNDVESIASDSQLRFSRYGNIRIPESTNCEKAFAKLCGSDDDNAGFIYECIQKLIRFDSETEALINDAALGSKAEFLLNRMRTKGSAVNVGRLSSKSDFASGFDISDVRFGRRIVSARFNGRFLRNRFKDVIYIDDEQVPLRGGKRFSKSLQGMFTKSATKSTSKTKSKTKSTKVKASTTIKDEAIKLDYQMNLLCDDNDSNDIAAIESINTTLNNFITTETVDGKEYIVYDYEKITAYMGYLDHQGLAYQMLSSIKKDIDNKKAAGDTIPNKILKMGFGGDVKYTELEVEKYGAGVKLFLTCDNDWLPGNEIDKKEITYTATEESAYNYFTTDGKYDWDIIEEWYQLDGIYEKSIEYDVLAYEMQNMSDSEIAQLLNLAEHRVDPYGYGYNISKKLPYLTDRHIIQIEALRAAGYTGSSFENKYTRAVMIKGVEECMFGAGGGNHHFVEISAIKDDLGRKIYTGNVTCTSGSTDAFDAIITNMKSRTVVVYPYGNSDEITANLYNESINTAYGMATTLTDETGSFIFDQTASFVFGKIGLGLLYTYGSEIVALKEAYESGVDAEGIDGMLNYCKAVDCMMISGVTVHVAGSDADSAYVYSPYYNDNLLVFSIAAYNEANGTSYSIEEMKTEFMNNSEEFENYQTWYTHNGADAVMDLRDEVIEKDGLKPSEIDAMPAGELEDYLAGR